MSRIHILDEHVANQIAAGEVVERPASVVKELVENAIDAGADRIDVTIEEGGVQLIRVSDNGMGMGPDDLELAFSRHATSKIASGRDLFRIRSLGFRGEALPSIAAVAKVECVTQDGSESSGRRLEVHGGAVQSIEPVAAARGTTITVHELFYNTPARLKYMKSIQTELGHISDYMYRMALAQPSVSFTLRHNGNVLLRTLGGGDLLQVIAAVYGTSAAKQMIAVKGDDLDFDLTGYISRPEFTRAGRTAITTIVNGRYIRSYPLQKALLAAYHTLLPVHRFPLAVLQLQMDPVLLDVNVHPSKLEIRFSKETELTQFIESVLRDALKQQVLIPQASKRPAKQAAVVQERLDFYGSTGQQSTGERSEAQTDPVRLLDEGADTQSDIPIYRTVKPRTDEAVRPNRPGVSRSDNRMLSVQEQRAASELYAAAETVGQMRAEMPQLPELYPIGQMHGTYILAQNEEGLFLIDQHAAHERIHYEQFYERFGNPAEASQQLAVPITLEFTPAEAAILQDQLDLFAQAGVYMEHFGGGAFIVRSHPYWFPAGEESSLIEEMAEWMIREQRSLDLAKLREKSAILASCKASIKANQHLTTMEIDALLARLRSCKQPYTCPHGRPIVISFSTYELEKLFKRVM